MVYPKRTFFFHLHTRPLDRKSSSHQPRADQSNIITSFHSFSREGQSIRTATQGANVPAGDGDGDGLETPVEVSKRVLDRARQQIVDTRTEKNGGVLEG